MGATMRDVAEAAGVSIATVSFVINDTKPVTPATRQRVEQAMAELGFSRHMIAKALASRRTQIIALVVPFIEDNMAPSVREFIVGAARAASEADHHLVIWPVSNDATEELATLVGQKLVDGVVLMAVQMDDARVETLRELDAPFALIGRTRDVTGLYYVDIDLVASMRLAMDHLAGLGHRHITFVNGSLDQAGLHGFGPHVRSEEAYRMFAADLGIEPVVLYCHQSVRAGRDAAGKLVATAPETTAVIVGDEAPAPGMVSGLASLGRVVPDDISVMSILSSVEVAAMCNPPLTTVTAPGIKLGRLGVESLLRRLNGDPPIMAALHTGVLALGESTRRIRSGSGKREPGKGPAPRSGRPGH